MNDTIADLMMRNLLGVFSETDSTRRRAAIAALYADDCRVTDPNEQTIGRDGLDAKVDRLQKRFPGFAFQATGPVDAHHDAGRLHWQFGPPGAPPAITGLDVALIENGRIRALYVFLDRPKG